MTGRWSELGPDGEAVVEAAFVALQTSAALARRPEIAALPSPSTLWAHVVGARSIPPAELAAVMLAVPGLRETLAGLLERAALAVGPRVAAAATGVAIAERSGDGFHLRLLPARGTPDQTWIAIEFDRDTPAPTRLVVLPASQGAPLSVPLEAPVDDRVQWLAEAGSELARALADPASTVYLL